MFATALANSSLRLHVAGGPPGGLRLTGRGPGALPVVSSPPIGLPDTQPASPNAREEERPCEAEREVHPVWARVRACGETRWARARVCGGGRRDTPAQKTRRVRLPPVPSGGARLCGHEGAGLGSGAEPLRPRTPLPAPRFCFLAPVSLQQKRRSDPRPFPADRPAFPSVPAFNMQLGAALSVCR